MRRGAHASRDLEKGEIIKEGDIKIIRPCEGIEPWFFNALPGRTVKNGLKKNDPVEWKDLT